MKPASAHRFLIATLKMFLLYGGLLSVLICTVFPDLIQEKTAGIEWNLSGDSDAEDAEEETEAMNAAVPIFRIGIPSVAMLFQAYVRDYTDITTCILAPPPEFRQ